MINLKLQTKYHGVREYKEEDIIEFPKGLPGFDSLKKFITFPVEDNEVFSILHSVEDESVGFVIVSPFTVINDYEFKLEDDVVEKLKITKNEDVSVVNIVTLNSKLENITINLRAPIIINIKEKLGEQIILNNEEYLIKYPIFKENV